MASSGVGSGVHQIKYSDGTFDVTTGSSMTAGTLICMESPLMSIKDYDVLKVDAAYRALSDVDRLMYDSFPTNIVREKILESEIQTLIQEYEDIKGTYSELLDSKERLRSAAKAMARFEYNHRRRSGTEYCDVPRMINFMQHDCVPNAVLSYHSKNDKRAVYACREIHPGANILISRVDCTLPMAQRKQALDDKGITECACSACGKPSSGLDQEESDRLQLFASKSVAEAASSEVRRSTYMQMLAVLSIRPEFSELECDIHHKLAEAFAEQGDFTRALAYISNAIELATACYGKEGDKTLSLIDFKEDIHGKGLTSAN